MSHKCAISGTTKQYGHRVSHANNKTKHQFFSNLQSKRIWIASKKKFARVRLSTRMIRTIDKIGLEETLRKHGMTLEQLLNG